MNRAWKRRFREQLRGKGPTVTIHKTEDGPPLAAIEGLDRPGRRDLFPGWVAGDYIIKDENGENVGQLVIEEASWHVRTIMGCWYGPGFVIC